MMDFNKKTCDMLLSLARAEKKNEILKQTLCELEDFEPYAAFTRIDRDHKTLIGATNVYNFLKDNKLEVSENDVDNIYIRHNDYDNDAKLCYAEFLKSILPNDQPGLRTLVSQRPTYQIQENEYLPQEIEITLAKLIESDITGQLELEPLKAEVFSDPDFSLEQLFKKIDHNSSGFIDFENLFLFFKKNYIYPYEEEIISIIRRLDKNDDGRLILEEFIEGLESKKNYKKFSPSKFNINYSGEKEKRNSFKQSGIKSSYEQTHYEKEYEKNENLSEPIVKKEYNLISKYSKYSNESKQRVPNHFSQGHETSNFKPETVEKRDLTPNQSKSNKFMTFSQKNEFNIEKNNLDYHLSSSSKSNQLSPPQSYPYEPVRKAFSPMKDEILRSTRTENMNASSPYRKLINNVEIRAKTPNLRESSMKLVEIEEKLKRLEDSYKKNTNYYEPITISKEDNHRTLSKHSTPTQNDYKSPTTEYKSIYSKSSHKKVESLINLQKEQASPLPLRESNRKERKQNSDDISGPNSIYIYLQSILNYESNVERIKQELALRPDFNLIDFFGFFDLNNAGCCSAEDFLKTLNNLKIFPQENETELFMRRYDRNNLGLLKFSDFCDAFTSTASEYIELLNQRRPINGDLQFTYNELFSPETRRIISNTLKCHFTNELAIENLRKAFARKNSLNINEIFDILDSESTGFLKISDFKLFFNSQGQPIKDDEIDLILKRLDIDKDGRISRREFEAEISCIIENDN